MSRESLLDDAIAKAKEAEDWQLVEWLRMARGGESAARWYTKKLQEEQDENDRLRNEFRKMDEWHSKELLAAVDNNAKLRELVRELWSCAASLAEDSVYHIEGAVCGCGINCVVNGEDCSAYKLRDRMRELGVEP